MAETDQAKARRVIYYTYDTDGRIRHTVCLIELKTHTGVLKDRYAKGSVYLSNQDYADDNFSIRAGGGIATQRANWVADLYMSGDWYAKGFSTRKTFGKGKGKISADKMQLLGEKELTPRDRLELIGLEAMLAQAVEASKSQSTQPQTPPTNEMTEEQYNDARKSMQ